MLRKIYNSVKDKIKFLWQKKTSSINIDQQLLRKIKGRKIPSVKQLKHIREVMSSAERKLFNFSILFLIIGVIWAGMIWSEKYRKQVPAVGGGYVEGVVGSPQMINPLFSDLNSVDRDIAELIYSGLMKYDKNQKLSVDLARDYKISKEGKEYTLTLRKDVKWHDGKLFTAEDVIFTFNTIKNKEINSPLYVAFKNVKVKKIGKYKVKFILNKPHYSFLHSLTVGILPEHIWAGVSPERMRLTQKNLQPIGTGPYKFKKLAKDNTGYVYKYDLSRNEDYYRKPPFIETLSFEFFQSYGGNEGAIQALREQSVDGLRFVPLKKRDEVKKKQVSLHGLELPQYTALFFNLKHNEFLKESKVRNAVSYAIDKNRIVQEALKNRGKKIQSPILPGFAAYSDKFKSDDYDVKKANELLDDIYERISEGEYKDIRKETLIQQFGLNNTMSTSTLSSFYTEDDPNPAVTFTGNSGNYDYKVHIKDNSSSTTDRNVRLKVEGEDIEKIATSNDTDFGNNEFKNYEKETKWQLTPGNGKKWVFVKLKDSQGNERIIYDTIKLTGQFLNEKDYKEFEISPKEENLQEVQRSLEQEIDKAQTFYRKDKDGNIVSIEITTLNTEEFKKTAKLLDSFLMEVGVRTDLKFVSSEEISREMLRGRNYESLLYGVVVGADGSQYPFWHSSQTDYPGLNLAQYSNDKVDRLLEEARRATSTKKRVNRYKKVRDILSKDQPAVFLYSPVYTYVQNEKVKGFDLSRISSPPQRFSNITEWYLKTKNEWDFNNKSKS